MTYKAKPQQKNPYPEDHEISNFGRPFLGHHNYILNWFVWSMPGSRVKDFLRNTAILHFLSQNYLPFKWGFMKFTISCLLTLQMLHIKFD